ncbi:hypothetical protein [Flavobacterium sp. B17]|nr:hypothetical protein [Flavobacterium sp. B17]
MAEKLSKPQRGDLSIATGEFPSFGGVAKIQRIFDGVVLNKVENK